MIATPVEGILFDLDNTLLDREAAFLRVANRFYDTHLTVNTSVTRTEAVAKIVEWDADGYVPREAMLEKWLAEWPDTGLDMKTLFEWYQPEIQRQVRPDMEVNAFLVWLNEHHVPWGIVTNGRMSQHDKCRAAGLDLLAPFIIVSEEVGYRKPDPTIFRDAQERTGIGAPEQIMFVGDNPEADVDGAKRFSMKAAWIRRGRLFPAGLMQPDHIVDHVLEVRHIVEF